MIVERLIKMNLPEKEWWAALKETAHYVVSLSNLKSLTIDDGKEIITFKRKES